MAKNKYSILMFASTCYPLYDPEAIVNSNLLLTMSKFGWKVNAITADKKHNTNLYPHVNSSTWSPLSKVIHSINAPDSWQFQNIFIKLWTTLRTGHIVDGLPWVSGAISVASKLASVTNFDVIISRSLPECSHLPALVLSRHWDIPWIANWNDPAPVCKFLPPRGGGPFAPVRFYTKRFLSAVALEANWHTFPSNRLKKYICSYLSDGITNKSSVIPHVGLGNLQLGRYKKRDRFFLCHAGGLNPKIDRDPTIFLKGAKLFLERSKKLKPFLIKFIGSSDDEVREIINSIGLNNIALSESFKPYEETLKILASADVLVVIEEASSEGIYLPSKFVDYVLLNRPILAVSPKTGTLSDLLQQHGGGIAADCTSPTEIADALETFYQSWKKGSLDSDFNTEKLNKVFSEDTVISLYEDIFKRIGVKPSY